MSYENKTKSNFFIILFSCKNIENPNKISVVTKEEEKCDIQKDSEYYLPKILNTPDAKSTLKLWNSKGRHKVMMKTNLPIFSDRIKVDSLIIFLADTISDEKDLILSIEKVNCKSGNFSLTTATPKSFYISGNFEKKNKKWIAETTSYVEQ